MTAPPATPPTPDSDAPADTSLVVEDARFAMVPEWVLDTDMPDAAFKLYVALLRYGATSGLTMPSRTTLARRLHRSTDAVDRALRALEVRGIVVVQRRRREGANLTNRYFVRTTAPALATAAGSEAGVAAGGGSRTSAATPDPASMTAVAATAADAVDQPPPRDGGGRTAAATGRTGATRVAAGVRSDREVPTERTPPPPPSPAGAWRAAREEEALLRDMNIDPAGGLQRVAEECARLRAVHGLGAACWQPPHLLAALRLAVLTRLWPARCASDALLRVAADPSTRSPMRLAEAGPWWDAAAAAAAAPAAGDDVEALEARLQALDSGRMALQAEARAELERERMPLTRTTVYQRACDILDRRADLGRAS